MKGENNFVSLAFLTIFNFKKEDLGARATLLDNWPEV
jgi:hypothetical protein